MSTYITRRLPNSTESRYAALFNADNANTLAGANTLLRTATITEMGNALTNFGAARLARQTAKIALNANTPLKNTAIRALRVKVSKFIQHLNDMIDDGSSGFQPSDRGYYYIEESDAAVPDLSAEGDVLAWGLKVKDGETARIAAGGTALTQPALADVTAAYNAAKAAYNTQLTLAQTYNAKQEDVTALNLSTDGTIKKIWAEVESASADDPDAGSRRAKAEAWGVVYVTVQEKEVTVKAQAFDIDTQQPIGGVEITSPAADLELYTDDDGQVTAKSNYIGPDVMTAEHPEYDTLVKNVTYAAGDLEVVFLMKKKP